MCLFCTFENMKPIYSTLRSFLLLVVLTASACKKSTDTGTITGAGGKLQGTIQSWDDKTTTLTDHSSFTVLCVNGGFTALTDAAGNFSFPNLPYDVYDLQISKSGFGTYRWNGISHASNSSGYTQLSNLSLGKQSTTQVTSLSVAGNTLFGQPGVRFDYGISPTPSTSNRAFVRYFLHTANTVSATSYTAYSDRKNFSNLSNETGFTKDELLGMGFNSSQTIYVRLVVESFISNDYTDPNSNRRVFPNVNETGAPVVSFQVP